MPVSAPGGPAHRVAAQSAWTSRSGSSSTRGASTRRPASSSRPCWAPPPTCPFADDSFDVAFSSFGALQFISDLDQAVAETARVLRPGGRFAFSITHPTRWMFPDDPGEGGLVASQSYWDRTPYVEIDDATGEGVVRRAPPHPGRLGGSPGRHGFVITDLLEPEWPEGHDRIWGGWSEIRGRLTPGTAIFGARLAP